jgi:outer membrane lipoprotein LolB
MLLSCLLAGCANVAPTVVVHPTTSARTYQEGVELNGRLSIRYQANGKDEALHGNFLWAQNPARTKLTLLSPLGQTVANIDITAKGATLQQPGNMQRSAPNVDELIDGTLGWPLPIAGLRNWLQGFGVDSNGDAFIASPQASEITTRDGWHIRYISWQDDNPEQVRPKRIDLERQTAQAGDVAIRIVIDTWQ